jgi:hypothetical protein
LNQFQHHLLQQQFNNKSSNKTSSSLNKSNNRPISPTLSISPSNQLNKQNKSIPLSSAATSTPLQYPNKPQLFNQPNGVVSGSGSLLAPHLTSPNPSHHPHHLHHHQQQHQQHHHQQQQHQLPHPSLTQIPLNHTNSPFNNNILNNSEQQNQISNSITTKESNLILFFYLLLVYL